MATRFRDLSCDVRLRVSGSDRVRFLNGQTSHDVRKANTESVQESCILNAKGHFDAYVFLFATDDAIWLSADSHLRERLPQRLERYIISDDVVIEDVTERFALFHFLSEKPPEKLQYQFCLRSQRLGITAWDIWFQAEQKERFLSTAAGRFEAIPEPEWETLRVEQGIPEWGRELTPEIIPPEANLAERAIDYNKGCYIGQEVISRIKMSGQLRQQLCGVLSEDNQELSRGMELADKGKIVGRITSAVFSSRLQRPIALAIIRRGFTEPGTTLVAAAAKTTVKVRITGLPFIVAPKS